MPAPSVNTDFHAAFFHQSALGMARLALDGTLVEINRSYCEILARSADELTGKRFQDFTHPEDRDIEQEQLLCLFDGALPSACWHKRQLRPNGTTCWVGVNASLVRDAAGKPAYLAAVIENIETRKQTETHLFGLVRDFIAFLDNINDCIYFKDRDGRFRFCSQVLASTTGHARWQDMIGKRVDEVFPEHRARAYADEEEPIFETGQPLVDKIDRYVAPNGEEGWISTTKWPVLDEDGHSITGIIGISRNITQRKRTELELERERIHLQTLVRTIPDLVWLKDPQGVYLACNHRFEEFFGAREVDIVGKTDYDFVDKQLADSFREHDLMAQRAGKPCINEEWVSFASDGHRELLEAVKVPMRDAAGTLMGVLGISRDITERKTAEETIRKLNADLSATLQAIPDLLFELDGNGTYREVWAKSPVLLAAQKELLLGHTIAEMLAPDAAETVMASLREASEKGTSYGKVIRLDLLDGSRWFELSVSQKAGGDEPGTRFIVLSRDITEREQLEETLRAREEEFRALAENSPDVIIRYDRECRRVYANPTLERVSGMPLASLIGNSPLDSQFLSPESRKNIERAVRHVLDTGRSAEQEVQSAPIDGRVRHFHSRYVPECGADGRIASVLVVSRDFTEQIELRQSLHSAKETAEAANRAKSEFLANMSHEIRTPLNAIIGLTQLMLDAGQLSMQQDDRLRKVHTSARSLLGIINGILDYSKIEAGRMELERIEFSPADVLNKVAILVQPAAQAKGLALSCDIDPAMPPLLLGDPLRFGQIVTNLAANAVKFTERGEVRIHIEALQRTGNDIVVRCAVRDTGIGLHAAQIERMFQPFTQADMSTTRQHGGTGLGLSISRRLAELMSGEMSVSSTPDVGSTFTFTARLGIATEAAARVGGDDAPHAPSSPQALQKASVLLVEDNPLNQEVAVELLTRLGVRVTVAGNGAQAVEHVRRSRFDAVLMDLQMPVMDGFEATRHIRRIDGCERLPIIAVTAAAMIQDQQACLANGMNDHIAKPIEPRELAAALSRWIASGNVPAPTPARSAAATRGAELEAELPGVAVADALRRLDGNVVLYRRLVQSFLDRHREMETILAGAADDDAADAVYRLAHSLKGEAGTLGLLQLQSCAEALVAAIKTGRPEAARPVVPQLRDALANAPALLSPCIRHNDN